MSRLPMTRSFSTWRKQWSLNECITYFLLTLVFLSSWTDINGIFSELPQIVLTQPEGWKLGAFIGLITNMGNIAPLVLVIFKCAFRHRSINFIPLNYLLIFIGMLSCLLLVFFWSKTTYFLHQNRSLSLLILSFFLSLLDCTSMVTFSDYITRFSTKFTGTIFLGESLTTILPSLLAIAQGNGQVECIVSNSSDSTTVENSSVTAVYQEARFSVSIYFLCIFLLLTTSLTAFVLLQWTKIGQTSLQILPQPTTTFDIIQNTNDGDQTVEKSKIQLTHPVYLLLSFGCVYTSGVLFGVLLSISAFVLMPYGQNIFYLGTILSPWMLCLVWIFGMVKPIIPKRFMLIMVGLGSVTFSFTLYFAFQSPCSPWANTNKGSAMVLIIWLSNYILLGYPRLVIANYVRTYSSNAMFWFGAQIQLGALIGSLIAYLMIETFGLFQELLPCEQAIC